MKILTNINIINVTINQYSGYFSILKIAWGNYHLSLKLNNRTKLIFSLDFYKLIDIENEWLQITNNVYYLHQQIDPEVVPSSSLLSSYNTWPLF